MTSPSSPTKEEMIAAVELTAKRDELVTKFWNAFEKEGIAYAGDYLFQQLQGSVELTQFILPALAQAGEEKGHSLSDMVSEWNEIKEKQNNDTSTTNNDGGRIHRVGSSEADVEPSKDESEQPSDADGNAGQEAGDGNIG
jgi:hypothetical protein